MQNKHAAQMIAHSTCCAGLVLDYSRFPSRQEAGAFVRSYLSEEATEPPVRPVAEQRKSLLLSA